MRLLLCGNKPTSRPFVRTLSPRRQTCSSKKSRLFNIKEFMWSNLKESNWYSYDAKRPVYRGIFSKNFSQQSLTVDFSFTSIIMCLSISLMCNKLTHSMSYNRLSHRSAKNFENQKFKCYNLLQAFCIRNSNTIPQSGLRTLLSCHPLIPLLENPKTYMMDARNLSSKAGKIAVGEKQSWEMLVDIQKLSALERKIHERHRNAVRVRYI